MLVFIPSGLNILQCAMLTGKSLADGKVGLLALLQDGMNIKLEKNHLFDHGYTENNSGINHQSIEARQRRSVTY